MAVLLQLVSTVQPFACRWNLFMQTQQICAVMQVDFYLS